MEHSVTGQRKLDDMPAKPVQGKYGFRLVFGLTTTQVPGALFPTNFRTRLPKEKHNSERKPLKKNHNAPLQRLISC